MCGLAGFLDLSRATASEVLHDTVRRMANTLRHRGPDDEGSWVDPQAGIAFGFRRLSIIDLSPEGHQPMLSATGRYVVAFNGEIYNHGDLRPELENQGPGTVFRGHSDTEVMLAAIERWGMEQAVRRFVGMFAFAVWDRQERLLHLGRDRIGEKPLYYGWMGETFLFGQADTGNAPHLKRGWRKGLAFSRSLLVAHRSRRDRRGRSLGRRRDGRHGSAGELAAPSHSPANGSGCPAGCVSVGRD